MYLMKTITFAAKADVSDIFASGNIREIVNTFSYNIIIVRKYTCRAYTIMLFRKKLRILDRPIFPAF